MHIAKNSPAPRKSVLSRMSLLSFLVVVGLLLWQGPALWRWLCLARVQSAIAESRWADATAWLKRLRWNDADSTPALMCEARMLRKQGDVSKARELLQRASLLRHSRAELQHEEWLIQAQQGDLASSEEPLLKTLQAERDVREILDALVQGYLRSGQYLKAEASVNSWRTMFPGDVRPYVLRGLWFLQLSDWTNATAELREALRRKPNDPDIELLLAEALLGDKHAEEAVELFRRSQQVWPGRESVALGLARALTTNGQPTQAVPLLQPFLERNPNATEVRQRLGEALLNSGRSEDAIRVLQPAAERSGRNVEIRYLLGTALRVVGRLDEAEPHLSFARQARQELQEVQRLHEHILQNLKNQSEKLQLASLLLKYDREAEAVIWLRSLLAEQPQHPEGRRLLAETFQRKADRESELSGMALATGRRVDRPAASAMPLTNRESDLAAFANTSVWSLSEVTSDVGIDFSYHNGRESGHATVVETIGGGVAWLDADLDGRLDLFLTGGGDFGSDRNFRGHPPALFRQITAEHFESVTRAAHLETAPYYSHGVAVADHDQDGFPDLLVTGYGGLLFFHNQGDGTFRECAEKIGLSDDRWSTSAGWGDLNGDGHLDVYVAHYLNWNWKSHRTCPGPSPKLPEVCSPKVFDSERHFVFQSQGDGTFREISSELDLPTSGKGLGVVLGDVDLDGDVDVYVGNDTTENFLYANDGHGHLEEVGRAAGVDVDDHGIKNGSMGVDLGDFDNDGLPDIWVTNYLWESFALYHNLGQQQFQHRSQSLGITAIGGLNVGWGTGFADLDRDGDEDLIAATGHVLFHSPPERQIPVVLQNNAGRRFTRMEFPTQSYFGQPHHGRGLALADYDNDGDLDFAVSHNNEPASLIRNDITSTGLWLQVRLIGRSSNRDAIGAWLVLHTTSGSQLRMIKGGGSYLSHSDRRPFWGIPAGEKVLRLEIHWPSGRQKDVGAPALNQTLTVIEP